MVGGSDLVLSAGNGGDGILSLTSTKADGLISSNVYHSFQKEVVHGANLAVGPGGAVSLPLTISPAGYGVLTLTPVSGSIAYSLSASTMEGHEYTVVNDCGVPTLSVTVFHGSDYVNIDKHKAVKFLFANSKIYAGMGW
jgi:hypothetical protein